jgi:hypothetical protein
MKLKEASIGTVITPGAGWELFIYPERDIFPERLEVVAHDGESVVCRPVGGGAEVHFYGELEVRR